MHWRDLVFVHSCPGRSFRPSSSSGLEWWTLMTPRTIRCLTNSTRLQIEGPPASSRDGESGTQPQALKFYELMKGFGKAILTRNGKRDYYEVLGVTRGATDRRSRAPIASSRCSSILTAIPIIPRPKKNSKKPAKPTPFWLTAKSAPSTTAYGHAGVSGGGGLRY